MQLDILRKASRIVMHANDTVPLAGLLDTLPTLPIEEQRAILQKLRQLGKELGCTIEYNTLVPECFFDFLANIDASRTFN